MTLLDYLIRAYCILFCLVWCILSIQRIFLTNRIVLFEEEDPPAPPKWPRLSVVIAACNEANTIEGAVSTLLEQNYPDMEIILVNDRSKDQTGKIIDDIAKRDIRVKSVHVKDLLFCWKSLFWPLGLCLSRGPRHLRSAIQNPMHLSERAPLIW